MAADDVAAASLLGAPQYHHPSPAFSAQTSAQLTPPGSDDGPGHDEGRDDDLSFGDAELGYGIDGDEAYELQERSQKHEDEDEDETEAERDASSEDYAVGSSRMRRRSDSTVASFQLYTPDEERAVVRKFDRRLVFFLSVCYMLSFLDRSNIGNARIAGMEEDLQTRPPNDEFYAWALTSFYIAYIAFEWMSLLWKIIPAHIYVSLIVLSWGVTASLQSVVTSYPFLIFLRVLLGIGEAGFTGVPFYLSFFFKRNELALRTAMFISAAPLATTFASTLAWLILKLGDQGPIASWRLLFLLEGFPSVVIATIAWSVIPDSPDAARYLTARERKVARLRLRHEKPRGRGSRSAPKSTSSLKPKEVLSAFFDPKAWITAVMFFLTNMAYSSLPVFLPTILKRMGHSALEAQALTAIPNFISFVTVLITAHVSDRWHTRTPFIMAHALASAAGYSVLALARPLSISPILRYLAVFPAAIGFFNVVVLILAWSINNQPSESKQGGGFALLQVVGQCGPIVGTRLYPDHDAPFFEPGMWACAGAMLGVVFMAVLLRFYLARQNRKLDASESRAAMGADAEEEQNLVGSGPGPARTKAGMEGFRYML